MRLSGWRHGFPFVRYSDVNSPEKPRSKLIVSFQRSIWWLCQEGGPQRNLHMGTASPCLWLQLVKSSVTETFFLKEVIGLWGPKGGNWATACWTASYIASCLGLLSKNVDLEVGWHKRPSRMPRWGMCCLNTQRVQQGAKFLFGWWGLKTDNFSLTPREIWAL